MQVECNACLLPIIIDQPNQKVKKDQVHLPSRCINAQFKAKWLLHFVSTSSPEKNKGRSTTQNVRYSLYCNKQSFGHYCWLDFVAFSAASTSHVSFPPSEGLRFSFQAGRKGLSPKKEGRDRKFRS